MRTPSDDGGTTRPREGPDEKQQRFDQALTMHWATWQRRIATRFASRCGGLEDTESFASGVVSDAWICVSRGLSVAERDAGELVEEFLAKKGDPLAHPTRFEGLLMTIARRRRALLIRRAVPRRKYLKGADAAMRAEVTTGGRAEGNCEAPNGEDEERMLQALGELTVEDQWYLNHRYRRGWSVDRIAQEQNILRTTADARIKKARQNLVEHYRKPQRRP